MVPDHALLSSKLSALSLTCCRMVSHARNSSRRRFLSFVAPAAELMYLTTSDSWRTAITLTVVLRGSISTTKYRVTIGNFRACGTEMLGPTSTFDGHRLG